MPTPGRKTDLYIGGKVSTVLPNGEQVTIQQSTNYPWDGKVKLQVPSGSSSAFTLHVRLPGWAHGTEVTLNGKKLNPEISRGFANITRRWAASDALELSVPLRIELLEANPNVLQSRGRIAVRRGPLIYCLEQPDNQTNIEDIAVPVTAKLAAHFEPALLGGVTVITGEGIQHDPDSGWDNALYRPVQPVTGKPVRFTAIPYCVWGNRGQKVMKVWMDTTST